MRTGEISDSLRLSCPVCERGASVSRASMDRRSWLSIDENGRMEIEIMAQIEGRDVSFSTTFGLFCFCPVCGRRLSDKLESVVFICKKDHTLHYRFPEDAKFKWTKSLKDVEEE